MSFFSRSVCVFALSALPLAAIAQTSVTELFPDVADDHPNASAIIYVQSTGLVSGYPNGEFRADTSLNRAEFTKILIGAAYAPSEIDACDVTTIPFADVPQDAWFAPFVCVAAVNRVVGGYPDGSFRPAAPVNVAEGAKIMSLALALDVPALPEGEPTQPWYQQYMEALEAKNALPVSLRGFDQPLTRGQLSEVVMRVRGGITDKPSLTYSNIANKQFEPEVVVPPVVVETAPEPPKEEAEPARPALYITWTQEAFAAAQQSPSQTIVFYHADWCPSCVALDAELRLRLSELPDGLVLLKKDYDSTPDFERKELSIMAQHTGVFYDPEGMHLRTVTGLRFDELLLQQ